MPLRTRKLRFESLEMRRLLTSVVIAPVDADLTSVGGSYLSSIPTVTIGITVRDLRMRRLWKRTIRPCGLADPPRGFNKHSCCEVSGSSRRKRAYFDLGGRFDLTGMALWNTTEASNTDRGFENTVLSYSRDNGLTFTEATRLSGRNLRIDVAVWSGDQDVAGDSTWRDPRPYAG